MKQSTPLIPPPNDYLERDEVDEAALLSLTLHKTALAAKAQENIAKVQEKLVEEEIDKLVEGDEDEESYENKDDEEIEKETKEEEIEKEVKDDWIKKDKTNEEIVKEKKTNTVEETNKVIKEKDIVDDVTGSMEIRKEQKQTPIPLPTRSPRNVSSSKK
nr:hypothetical protein [Tanacetum cinerariifolium]